MIFTHLYYTKDCGILLTIKYTHMSHERIVLTVTALLVYCCAMYLHGMTSKHGPGGSVATFRVKAGFSGVGGCPPCLRGLASSMPMFQAPSEGSSLMAEWLRALSLTTQ